MRALFTQFYGSSITFTFIHLAGTFIQSDIQMRKYCPSKGQYNTSSDTIILFKNFFFCGWTSSSSQASFFISQQIRFPLNHTSAN